MEEAHLKAVLDFWSAFDLDGKRLHLDKQGLLLQEAKDGSAKARKALGEMTRDFRRADDEQKLLTMNELLRAYQAEIDALTKRSKSAETNFFSLYRDLFEAPDPVPCLKRCLESVVTQGGAGASSTSSSSTNATTNSSTMSTSTSSDAQENRQRYLDEIAQLKAELEQYEMEFRQLKNQDITIRRLEEALSTKTEEANKQLEETKRQMEEEVSLSTRARWERDAQLRLQLQQRAEAAEAAVRTAEAALEAAQAQNLEAAFRGREREAAWSVERDILTRESEQVNRRAAQMERELEKMRESQPEKQSDPALHRSQHDARELLEADISELTQSNARLRNEMLQMDRQLKEEQRGASAAAQEAEERLQSLRDEVAELTRALAQKPARETMHALRLLQQLESDAEDTEGPAFSADEDMDQDSAERAVQSLIERRFRRIESELVTARQSSEKWQENAEKLREMLARSEHLAADRLNLLRSLEEDISQGAQEYSRSETSPSTSTQPPGDQELSRLLAPRAERETGEQGGGEGAILSVVQRQRDRFKVRILELEGQQEMMASEAVKSAAALEELQRDNLRLYERVRFLLAGQGRRPSVSFPLGPPNLVDESGAPAAATRHHGGGVEQRYSQLYESRLDPFSKFSQNEHARKVAELGVAERMLLHSLRVVLSSRAGRTILVVYIVFLHVVVFFVLLLSAHSRQQQQQQMPAVATSSS